jgi:hypothetical protein
VRAHSTEIQPLLSRASLYVSMDKTITAEKENKSIETEEAKGKS